MKIIASTDDQRGCHRAWGELLTLSCTDVMHTFDFHSLSFAVQQMHLHETTAITDDQRGSHQVWGELLNTVVH